MKHQQNPISTILTIVLFTLFFISCSKSGSNPPPKNTTPSLTVTSLNVNTGPYNTGVIITGTEFSSTIANDQVFFNGKAAVVTAATPTQLTATVPLGAGTGAVSVAVNNGTPVNGPTFTYQLSEVVSSFAGTNTIGTNDGIGTNASFTSLEGMTVDGNGNLFVVDNNSIRKITPDAVVSTVAGGITPGRVNGVGAAASFDLPWGISIDATGNLYVADQANALVRKITPAGQVSTLAGSGAPTAVDGIGTSASFAFLFGITTDPSGNVYVADLNKIRKITPNGSVSTFAGITASGSTDGMGISASFNGPGGLVSDASGNIYVADGSNNLVRKISPSGNATTFAGNIKGGAADGTGINASFNSPVYLAIDASGNIFVTDRGNDLIREISPSGVVTTLAGSTNSGVLINGPAKSAAFQMPLGIAADAKGNVYVADDIIIRKISMQ